MSQISYPMFLGSEIQQGTQEESFFHVVPVPYERSVSYGSGTALGPFHILDASWQLEQWDGKSKPSELGICTYPVVDCSGTDKEALSNIIAVAKHIALHKKFPVFIGGEHTVTGGVIGGLLAGGFSDFGVVQIDAHADLREAYEGNPLSHASCMKRVVDLGVPLYQLGNRAYCEEEIETRKKYGVGHLDADVLVRDNINALTLPDNFPPNVFFTLDIDGMDPSIFPSTGTPVPGGLGWYQTLSLFESVVKQRNVIGFDVMEFSPIKGFHAYEFAAAQLIYNMMGIVQRNRN